jgi:hypothetical protein
MANWELDALIELLEHKYKAMQFPNSIKGWQSHSGNMPLVLRCQNFSDLEYTRRYDVESFDAKFIDGILDQGEPQEGHHSKRQKTVVPRRAKEKQMVAKILSRSGACTKQAGQRMRENLLWDELPNLTTILKEAAEVDAELASERRTDKELVVSNITNEFFDDDGVAISTEAETEANAELNPAVLAALTGIAPGGTLEETEEIKEEEEVAEVDGVEVKITVGNQRFGKVNKIKVNPLCLKDVNALGRQKMVQLNVLALQYRRKQRARREGQFLQTSLLNTLNGTTGNRTMDLV